MYDLAFLVGGPANVDAGPLANYTDWNASPKAVVYPVGRTRRAYQGLDSTMTPNDTPEAEWYTGAYLGQPAYAIDPDTGQTRLIIVSQ